MTKNLPRARVTRRTATVSTRAAGRRMTGLTRRRTRRPRAVPAAAASASGPFSQWSRLLELLGVASLGGWRGKAGEGEEGGWRAVKSEYDGTDAFVAYWRSVASSFGSSPGTIITSPLLDGRRDVLLVSSAARTSPRHSFCPPAIPMHFLMRGTRKGLRASYLFLGLKPAGTCRI